MPDYNDERPPKVQPKLKGTPKIKRMYWCEFPSDAQLPELWKTRPVIILSFRNKLHGAVTVIPCSTMPQDDNKWAVKLTQSFQGVPQWAVCDKITTVAVSRLWPDKGGIIVVKQDEFDEILSTVLDWIPKPI